MAAPHGEKKLGILIAAAPGHPNFRHGLHLAQAALDRGLHVYLYCIDDAVRGLADEQLQSLKPRGLNVFACAFAAHQRGVPTDDRAAFSGLGVVSDLMAATDRFVALN